MWSREGIWKLAFLQGKMKDNRKFEVEREYLCQVTSILKQSYLLGVGFGERKNSVSLRNELITVVKVAWLYMAYTDAQLMLFKSCESWI